MPLGPAYARHPSAREQRSRCPAVLQFLPITGRELGYLALLGAIGVFIHHTLQAAGLVTTLSKRALTRRPPTLVMAYVMALGWLMLLPLFVADAGWHQIPELSPSGWAALLFLGLFYSGLAYLFWYGALQGGDASQVAAFLYLEPLVTLIIAALVLGEPITVWTLAGGAAVLAGVWLVNRSSALTPPDRNRIQRQHR